MPLVVDASITLSWYLADEESEYANRVLDSLRRDQGLVPSIWSLEVANGLLVAERRGRVTRAEVTRVSAVILSLPILLREVNLESALGHILELGYDWNLTAYDAAYLNLAMQEALPIATLDANLRRAAAQVGVPLVS